MRPVCFLPCQLLLIATCSFFWPSPSDAATFLPGQSVPGTSAEVLPWSVSDADSTYASWDSFADFPGGSAPGFLPAGTSPAPGDSFIGGGTGNQLTFLSNQSLASSGNAYGGLFGPGDSSSFVTDAFATVRSGTSGGGFTRIVTQFETLGSELDYTSILLSPSVASEGTIAPSFAIETARSSLGGTFGGESVSYLAMWDIAGSQSEYRVDFNAAGSNMSIDRFRIDSFTSGAALITPSAVPEPSALALMGLVAGGMAFRRRRKSTVS